MQIDTALIKLMLLAMPGIVSFLLYRKLTGKKTERTWQDIVEVAIFSLVDYGLLGGIYGILNLCAGLDLKVRFLEALLLNASGFSSWYEIGLACGIGAIVPFVASVVYTRSWFNRLGYRVGVTKRTFDGDLWESFHGRMGSKWVFVRDHKVDLVYYGWVQGYSESGQGRELILRDVRVYKNKQASGMIYSADVLYVSRKPDELSIEVPVM